MAVVRAPGGLAINGDEVVAARPKGGNPALEAAGEQERVDAVDEGAQPALAGDAVVEGREAAQNGEVVLAPGDDVIEVVARSKGRAGDQQQHLVKRVEHAPEPAPDLIRGSRASPRAASLRRTLNLPGKPSFWCAWR